MCSTKHVFVYHHEGLDEREREMKKRSEKADGGISVDGGNERVALYELFTFADPLDVVLMCVGTIAAIINGLSMPLVTVIFGQMIDSFGNCNRSNVVHEVSKAAVKFVCLAAGTGVASFLQVSSWTTTGERQAARIRGLYMKSILRQDIAFFDKETTTGEVVVTISRGTILVQDAMGEKVGKFIQLVSTFIGGFVVAFVKGWLLTLVMLSCIPPLAVAGAAVSIFISKMSSHGQIAYAEAGNIAEQTIGSIRTVASFTGEKKAVTKYNKSLKPAYKATVQQGLVTGLGNGAFMFIIFSIYGLAVWYGSRLIIQKGYSGGDIMNVLFAIISGGMSLGQASPSVNAFAAGKAAAYKMFDTIKRQPEISSCDTGGIELEDIRGEIELRNVDFSYPSRPSIHIFSGFSLHVPSGTTVAIVGESGSGKSTVINLIERFYDPKAGKVLIDGINLKKMRLGWIREKIGLVSQEPVLFATSIKENILYGRSGATLKEIRESIKLANASKFIRKLTQGIDTLVGEHGTQLSGGQKQRIAIARAILKNPKILLLDEATSALDVASERVVQEALGKIMVDRTTVVVAHRLSTVRNANKIAVVHQGKLVEQGSHAELIKDPNGVYSQLVRLQNMNDQPEKVASVDLTNVDLTLNKSKTAGNSERRRFSIERRHSSTMIDLPCRIGGTQKRIQVQRKSKEQCDGNEDALSEVSLRRLAYLNKPELPELLLGSIAAGIQGLFFPLFGTLLSSAIKIFYEPPHKLRKYSKLWALGSLCLGITALVVILVQHYLFGVAGAKLIRRVRSLSFERVVNQEISWFDEHVNSSGMIGARLSADASTLQRLVGDFLALMVQNMSTVIAGLAIAMVANWQLTLIILVLLPLIGLQGYAQAKLLKGFSMDTKVAYGEASQIANDAVRSIRTVASFCAEHKVMDLYMKKCNAPTKNGIREGIVSGVGFGFSNFVLICTYAMIFYIGAHFVEKGKATSYQVFKVFFVLNITALTVSQTSALVPDTTKAMDSVASIFAILDRKSKIDSSNDEGMTLPIVKGEIEFQYVSFRYPTRPNVWILKDLCLSIPSGKTVALVGESGSGKSTVIALLERFYDPNSGLILLDGVEIWKFKLQWLRQQMGLVSQEPVLFNDTIRANIAYGMDEKVSEDEINAVAEAANAHCFISVLPQGYDTCVGERGVQLSGGQKQRIAIARAILKDPKILLLDEATSALDAESEHVVQEALDRVIVNRSTIVVAHRLSTIKGANVIAVMKNGVIAEKGRHKRLMKMKYGIYASLVALHMNSST